MPFKSKRQQRWMYANEPKMAARWSKETDFSHLPELKDFFPDRLHGGKADRRNPSDFDPDELRMGIEHELEHTTSRATAMEIAMDHLAEDPYYYSDMKAAGRLFSSEEDE